MNREIYTGRNRLENWLIDQRTHPSTLRTFTRTSDPEKITVDDRSTLRAVKDVRSIHSAVTKPDSDTWERFGAVAGGVAFAGLYSLTYPVVWADGPLPFVDAAWAFGMLRFTRSGTQIGREVGSWFD